MLQFVKWLLSLFSQSKIHKTLIFKKRKKNLPEKIFKKLNKSEILPEHSVFTKILTPKWVDLRTIVASQSLLMFPTLDKTKLKTDNSVAKKKVLFFIFWAWKKNQGEKRESLQIIRSTRFTIVMSRTTASVFDSCPDEFSSLHFFQHAFHQRIGPTAL